MFVAECREADFMTNETRHVIRETFENVKAYFEHVVKVDRLLEPFQLHPGLYPLSRSDSGETDLFITLYPRPYGPNSAIMAAASPAGKEDDTGRTIQGLVFLNLAVLPFVPSNFSTVGNRKQKNHLPADKFLPTNDFYFFN